MSSVLTESATSTLMMIFGVLAPLAASAAAIEAASTLITATAGESGPPIGRREGRGRGNAPRAVTTVPMISPARPSGKPAGEIARER